MSTWRDRVDRLNQSVIRVFGESAIYTPLSTGTPVSCEFHFESVSQRVDANGRYIDAEAPTAYVRITDMPFEPEPGDTLTAQSVTYTVVSGEPDGYGAMRLWLRKGTA